MRIAQIASITESVPPSKYGGTERVISALTEELVKRGHEVTLFATGDSLTSARLVSSFPHALRKIMPEPSIKRTIMAYRHVAMAYAMQNQFDVIHDHTSWIGAGMANISKVPVVMTLHGAFTEENTLLMETIQNPYLVSISNAQRRPAPGLNYIATIYNGLPMEHYPVSVKNDGYLLYVGRFCQEKSPHYAIEVAKRLKLPLIMAAKLEEGASKEYFQKHIEPHLSKQIRWVGEVNEEQRNFLFSRALCSLHPVSWPEPFGLTLIEAMACGTPVIAFDNGSIPEVIKDGKTGYVVKSVDEMTKAVLKIKKIDRMACRSYALSQFNVNRMVDRYEMVYEAILGSYRFNTPSFRHYYS